MKKIFGILLLVLLLAATLAGCGLTAPRPEIEKGEFPFSVTYEFAGEIKTVSGVYVCEYNGTRVSLDGGAHRDWKSYFKGGELEEMMEIGKDAYGETIDLNFDLYPEYFMGEPDYAVDYTPTVRLSLIYESDEEGEGTMICEDEAVIAGYGFKLIDFTYDAPIENTFVSLY